MTIRKQTRLPFIALVLALVLVPVLSVSAITGDEIAENVESRPSGDTSHALVQMLLIDSDDTTQERVVEQYSAENADGLTRSVIMFHRPASVKDTRFLTVENANQDDDQWIYLPALRRVRRIAASEGGSSFMGTDFSYDDLTTRDTDDYNQTYLRDEELTIQQGGGQRTKTVHVVEVTPKSGTDSQYSKIVEYVDPEMWLPIKVELYEDGELLKINTMERVERVQGFWTPIVNVMENAQTGHRTELRIQRFEYNQNVPDGLFTTNFLRTGRP